ncbi:hypothetical protein TNCV_2825691 [Trichonephila clavipes]|nr:hypothetical protein TNCV_2825691 [Trichonephila clavipes]
MAFSSKWTINKTNLFILLFPLTCALATYMWMGWYIALMRKCQELFSMGRSGMLIYGPSIGFRHAQMVLFLERTMVIGTKTYSASCRSGIFTIKNCWGCERSPPKGYKETDWKVTDGPARLAKE